jgi:hypothetical protein
MQLRITAVPTTPLTLCGPPTGLTNAIEVSGSLSFPVGVRRRNFGDLWRCRCFGETVWSGGAGNRAETSIDRFQSVRGVLCGESRRCNRGPRVIVVHLSSSQTPRSPFPSLLSGVTQVRGHSEWILRVVAEASNERQMSSRMHWWSRRILMVTLAP